MNIQHINAELRQKFKRMSPEQFEQYVYELRCIYIKEHPSFRRITLNYLNGLPAIIDAEGE